MQSSTHDIQIRGRIVMVTKDVEVIYACHRTTAGRRLNKIRVHYNKPEGDVTMFDFSEFTGIPLDIVKKCML